MFIASVSKTLFVTIVEFCGNCVLLYAPLFPLQVEEWVGWREEAGYMEYVSISV